MKKNTGGQGSSDTSELYEKFNSLTLDQKFVTLFKMELTAIGDAINFIVKDPMKVVEKIGDTLTEFGTKIESEVKKASGSPESGKKEKGAGSKASRARGPAEPVPPAG
jgi:hypothetical protein